MDVEGHYYCYGHKSSDEVEVDSKLVNGETNV
jgi:hypothetical protein